MLDLPGHDGAGHAFFLEGFDQFGQFAQREPMYCRRAMSLNFRRGFFFDGGDNDFEALRAGGIQHQQGEASDARDEAETLSHGRQWWGLNSVNSITRSAVCLLMARIALHNP